MNITRRQMLKTSAAVLASAATLPLLAQPKPEIKPVVKPKWSGVLPTGFPTLDKAIGGGLKKGDKILWIGPAMTGKSFITDKLSRNVLEYDWSQVDFERDHYNLFILSRIKAKMRTGEFMFFSELPEEANSRLFLKQGFNIANRPFEKPWTHGPSYEGADCYNTMSSLTFQTRIAMPGGMRLSEGVPLRFCATYIVALHPGGKATIEKNRRGPHGVEFNIEFRDNSVFEV